MAQMLNTFRHFLWNSEFHYIVNTLLPKQHILCRVYQFVPYLKIHICIIITFVSRSPKPTHRVTVSRFCTWCDNLIPEMALWKQNFLTCALTAAVAFGTLSLWSYALRETMVSLLETFLKIVFRNTSLSRCVVCQKGQQIFVPSGYFLILERAK
jgi:hypothetical protein